jgi:G3E family GTPase
VEWLKSGGRMIVDVIYGFLGSGKTTFIIRVLQEWGDKEKIVVLVNEFGEIGIDGTLLWDQGGKIVEMPSGCICCTLQSDFRSQMLDILQTIHPERLIIEPTGVATIAQVRSIIEAQIFEDAIAAINNVLIADATGFMSLYKANPHFVESQVKNARLVLLNKCDMVDHRRALLTRDAISAINPEATVLLTEYGGVDWGQYQLALAAPPSAPHWQLLHAGPTHLEAEEPEENHIHGHTEPNALGYESFGFAYDDLAFNQPMLEDLFRRLNSSEMGEVVRAKGIFQIDHKWILMDLASGEISTQPVRQAEQSKVSIIGKRLDRKAIGAALEKCVSGGAER